MKALFEDEGKRTYLMLIVSGLSLVISFFKPFGNTLPFDAAWIAVIFCGFPIIKGAVLGLIRELDIKADVLVAMALIAAVFIGEIFAAGEVAFIMTIGALLEERTVAKARAGIEKLVNLTPQTARVIWGGKESIVLAEEVKIGDLLRVLPGETIAVDGIIRSGQTSISQAVMTGESLPVDKSIGDEVYSGTVNQYGSFEMEATKLGEDSSLQRMIQLVESADASKAKISRLTDTWATWIVVIALGAAIGTWFITGEIIRSVTILVVFCPCALVLATPTAIMAGIGNASKYGILIREGDALERLAKVKRIAFDKTGTLTYGKPEVAAVKSFEESISDERLLALTAGAEAYSEHPLGKAVIRYFESISKEVLKVPNDFVMQAGRGVLATVEGQLILAGNAMMLSEKHIELPKEIEQAAEAYKKEGFSIIYIAVNQKLTGLVALSDTLRKDTKKMISHIQKLGLKSTLITGDNSEAATYIQKKAGVLESYSSCLPEDKLAIIENYQSQDELVCMVGDGVNDAPALKKAYVGIAMGAIGSDIAVDAADIALISDDIKYIPHLVYLSRKTMKTINLNIILSMGLNFAAIFLAMTGVLNPVVGALVHNIGSVVVIINSALLLNKKDIKLI